MCCIECTLEFSAFTYLRPLPDALRSKPTCCCWPAAVWLLALLTPPSACLLLALRLASPGCWPCDADPSSVCCRQKHSTGHVVLSQLQRAWHQNCWHIMHGCKPSSTSLHSCSQTVAIAVIFECSPQHWRIGLQLPPAHTDSCMAVQQQCTDRLSSTGQHSSLKQLPPYLWTSETEEACSADHCYWSAATVLVLLRLQTRGPCITAAAGFNCKLDASWFASWLQARGGCPTCWLITLCLALLLIPATARGHPCQNDVH